MKKLFAMALASILVMSTITTNITLATSNETPIDPFSDVFQSTDYNESIIWMSDNGIIQGYEDGTFGPDNCVTRSELLKMIFKMKEIDETSSTAELFPDTPEGQWFTPYVRTARERNTIQGYKDGTFRPGACVNRVEAIKIAMLEFTNLDQTNNSPLGWLNYVDVNKNAWYMPYFNQAINTNTVGTAHITYDSSQSFEYDRYDFYPGDSMTRKEVAEMLFRLKAITDLRAEYYEDTISPNEILAIPITTNRLSIEDVFPQDILAVLELDLSSSAEINNFNKIVAKFPYESDKPFKLEDSMKTFLDLIGESGAKADFENAFQDNTNRFVFGIYNNDSVALAVEVKDNSKINRLIETVTSGTNPLYYEQNVLGFRTMTSVEGYLNIALAGNVVLISHNWQSQYMTLRNIRNHGAVLGNNSIYKAYQAGDLSPKFASTYINNITDIIPTIYGDVSSENISFSAQRDGIEMLVQADADLGITYKQPYMYREIPGKNLIMYMESYGLDELFNTGLTTASNASYELNAIIEDLEDAINVDIENDIIERISSGYAIVWQENETLMPGVSVYADVNNNKAEAEAMIADIHSGVTEIVDELIATAPDGIDGAKVFKLDTVKIGGNDVNRLTIDFSILPEEELENELLPMGFFDKPIEFFYGITGDNYLMLSTYADLEIEYGSSTTVATNDSLASARNRISDYRYGVSYANVEMILDYVEEVVVEMETINGPMSEYEREEYEMIMSDIRPIKYIISANGTMNSAEIMKGMFFINIK